MIRFNELNSIHVDNKFVIKDNVNTEDKINIENSMIFLGDLITETDIVAKHNCIVLGNVEADNFTTYGDMICLGDFNVSCAEISGKLLILGKVNCSELYCSENIILDNGRVYNVEGEKSIFVDKVLEIDECLKVAGSSVFMEGVLGRGRVEADKIIVSEYCEVNNINGDLVMLDELSNKSEDAPTKNQLKVPMIDLSKVFGNNKGNYKLVDNQIVRKSPSENLIDMLKTVPEKKLIDTLSDVNTKIAEKFREFIISAEDKMDYEELSRFIGYISENFIEFRKGKQDFDEILEYADKSSIDNIFDYFRLMSIYNEMEDYIKKISIINDTYNYLIKSHRSFEDMQLGFNSSKELLEFMVFLEENKSQITKLEYKGIIRRIDSKYRTNFDELDNRFHNDKISCEGRGDNEAEIIDVLTSEVSDISAGIVKIKNIVCSDPDNIFIALYSHNPSYNPTFLTVLMLYNKPEILTRLGNKKINLVVWSNDPMQYIKNSLGISNDIKSLIIIDEGGCAFVYVPVDKMPMVIGKQGFRVRNAAKLTGFNIKIMELK